MLKINILIKNKKNSDRHKFSLTMEIPRLIWASASHIRKGT